MERHHEARPDRIGVHVENDLRLTGLGDTVDPDRQIAVQIFFDFTECYSIQGHINII
jgi:hypothetical protein